MPYEFYRLMHLLGIFMVFSALGGQFVQALNKNDPNQQPGKRWGAIFHGVGLLLILTGGFGMLARLRINLEEWVIYKLVIWIVLGGIGVLASRKSKFAGLIWGITLGLGLLAARIALTKGG